MDIKPISTKINESIVDYMQTIEQSKNHMQNYIGIPTDRLGFSYDSINREVSKTAFNAMIENTAVMYRTYFDKVTNKMVTAFICSEKTTRIPRKLKKRVKTKFKLCTTSRSNLAFNLEVLKMSKYYGRKILKEKILK